MVGIELKSLMCGYSTPGDMMVGELTRGNGDAISAVDDVPPEATGSGAISSMCGGIGAGV
jgi:hypothetical protein